MPLGEVRPNLLNKQIRDVEKNIRTVDDVIARFRRSAETTKNPNSAELYSEIANSLEGKTREKKHGETAFNRCLSLRNRDLQKYILAKEQPANADYFPDGGSIKAWHDYSGNILYYHRCVQLIGQQFGFEYSDIDIPAEFQKQAFIFELADVLRQVILRKKIT